MTWERIYEAMARVDEPLEGAEIEWAEAEYHGEELTITIDSRWPAAPRVALAAADINPASVVVTLAPGKRVLRVEDYTGKPAATPPEDAAYVRAHDGPEHDTTFLYFHPAHRGARAFADYRYYLDEGVCHAFVARPAGLEFCESETGKWLAWSPGSCRRTGWLGAGGAGCAGVITDGGIYWTLVQPAASLARYSTEWSGYLDVRDVSLNGLEFLGYLSQAGDARAVLTPGGRLEFAGEENGLKFEVPARAIFSVQREGATIVPIKVEMEYNGGRARVGAGATTCSYRNPLITSASHATIICRRIYNRLRRRAETVTLTCSDEWFASPGNIITWNVDTGEGAVSYRVVAARRDLINRTAQLTLMRLRVEDDIYGLGE